MADIFRKSSLDKLSNPEQLDRMIKISSPLSWLALIAVLAIIAVTVVWSIVGTLPTTETVNGIIVNSENAVGVYSDVSGILEKYHVKIGDKVKPGDKLADIKVSDSETKTVKATSNGKISAFSAEVGTGVLPGSELARLTPDDAGSQIVICYVPLMTAQKFEKEMQVLIYPASVDSQKYGHMEAEIVCVEEYATNTNSMAYVLGSGNLVAEQFVANGPVVAVVCKIKTDASSKNGFYWSSENGKQLSVSNNSIVSAKIVVDECAPITKLIGTFNDDAED